MASCSFACARSRIAQVPAARVRLLVPVHRSLSTKCRASPDLDGYWEAFVETVRLNDTTGPVIYLRLNNGADNTAMLPVFVGEFEGSALVKEINNRTSVRPLTHDLFKTAIEVLGYKVALVRIHSLIGNTYHARIHLQRKEGGAALDIDARPSDALNLAARFKAPIYVSKAIAERMAKQDISVIESHNPRQTESNMEITKSCKAETLLYKDPTVMLNLALQVAIEEERYEDASRLRNRIEKMISSDQSLRLIVAIDSALVDGRYEEAAKLRDELRAKRQVGTARQLENGL